VGGWLRLSAAVGLLLLGALVVFPAPTYRAWLLSLPLAEFGHLLAGVSLLLLWPGWHRTRQGMAGAACGVIAAACFLTPLVRGLPVAQALPRQLDAAFGGGGRARAESDAPARVRPIDPVTLFTGVVSPEVGVTRVQYAQRGSQTLSLDLYLRERPADAPPAPIIVIVHGGGWHSGSPAELPALNAYLAARGYLVAVPEYRLAPASPFPDAVEDVRTAIALLRGRARQWNADADGLVVIGRSAGAQIALAVAYSAGVGAMRGAVSLYGPADLTFAWEHPGNPRVYDGIGTIERYLGGPPASLADRYRQASPYEMVQDTTPPTLLVHGRKDEIVWVEQSRRLATRLAAASRPALLVELPWATHGCDFTLAGPCGQIVTYAIERFVAAVTAQ
jgi:acetyl esterase/lipase